MRHEHFTTATLIEFNVSSSLEGEINGIIEETIPEELKDLSMGETWIKNERLYLKIVSFLNPIYLKSFIKRLTVLFDHHNETDYIFKDISDYILDYKFTESDINNEFKEYYLNKFRFKNMNIDQILDKVNDKGMSSLTQVEIDILNQRYENND